MADLTVARRYAQALYEEAEAAGHTAAVDEDVAFIHASMKEAHDLAVALSSPVIPREKKLNVVRALFGERVRPLTLRFLELIVDKGREESIGAILQAYRDLRDRQEGIVEAHARTAQPLGETERAHLVEAIERMTGKRVRLDVTRDPALIGGVVIRVGDTVYDGSVRHQLASLREQLVRGVPSGHAA